MEAVDRTLQRMGYRDLSDVAETLKDIQWQLEQPDNTLAHDITFSEGRGYIVVTSYSSIHTFRVRTLIQPLFTCTVWYFNIFLLCIVLVLIYNRF